MDFFPTSPSAAHVSPWPGVLLHLIQTVEGLVLVARSCCSAEPGAWLPFRLLWASLAALLVQPQPQPCGKTDGGTQQLHSIAVGSGAHQARQLLMAPRTLAGKQGDFKVVATPEQAWKYHSRQMTGWKGTGDAFSAVPLCSVHSTPLFPRAQISKGAPKSLRLYSEILFSSPPSKPMPVLDVYKRQT